MFWILIAISAYFIFAITALIDKYILTGPIKSPKIYVFYVGLINVLALALIPFVNFSVPKFSQILISFLAGAFFILGLFAFFRALKFFEASRIVPAIGGFLPLFTFTLIYIVSLGKEIFCQSDFFAFVMLIFGSVIISLNNKKFTIKSIQMSLIAAFLFSLAFIFTKFVYLEQPFWSGFIWMRFGGFLAGLCFLFSKEVRDELFKNRIISNPKTYKIFFLNQGLGASAFILQNWAIALAPLVYLSVINALQGVQYVFLFIFAIFLSLKFPQIIKEEISKKILFQKIFAILFITAGLAILAI